MGGAACPLHDAGNDRSIERGSDLQAARRGSLTTPAKPAGERESDAALTPRPGTRSRLCLSYGAATGFTGETDSVLEEPGFKPSVPRGKIAKPRRRGDDPMTSTRFVGT